MKQIIYGKIIDEDIDVWKPVEATKVSIDTYRIDANDSELEFRKGDLVQVREKEFCDGTKGIIAYRKLSSITQ